jgi:glycerophosphoryl diester phosphodiesterase
MAERPFSPAGRTLVVAHRGDPRRHPENSLRGFVAALDAGADAIELDVRLTLDDVPVVIHDATVDRTTEGAGLVRGMSVSDLRRLRLRGGGAGDIVPTLREALDAIAAAGGAVDVEVKNIPGEPDFDGPDERLLLATLDELSASSPPDVLIKSFNPSTLRRCREVDASIATGLLTIDAVEPMDGLAAATAEGCHFLLPSVRALEGRERALTSAAHAAGVRLGAWTADDPATVSRLASAGVDAIATNDPAMAASVVGGAHAAGRP